MELPIKYSTTHFSIRKLAREEYAKQQEGLCYHCHCPLSGPPAESVTSQSITKSLFPIGFFKWPLHLHHNHKTDLTIGVVHNYCNAVLWEHHGE